MDYLHYRFKKWKPFEYMQLPQGQKAVARAYMKKEIEDRAEESKGIAGAFSGLLGGD